MFFGRGGACIHDEFYPCELGCNYKDCEHYEEEEEEEEEE